MRRNLRSKNEAKRDVDIKRIPTRSIGRTSKRREQPADVRATTLLSLYRSRQGLCVSVSLTSRRKDKSGKSVSWILSKGGGRLKGNISFDSFLRRRHGRKKKKKKTIRELFRSIDWNPCTSLSSLSISCLLVCYFHLSDEPTLIWKFNWFI